jgi:FkbM family methyltransferase
MNRNRLMALASQKFLSLMTHLEPWLPAKWRLGLMARSYSFAGWEPEVLWLKKIGPCRGMAVDAGANKGFYSLALSRLYSKVVAFEPNKHIAASLIAAELPRVEIVHVGLSSRNGVATFYIPSFHEKSLPGWGSLDEHNCPDATAMEKQMISLRTLDSYRFKGLGFVKIDVEGHEVKVLRGAVETIQRERPHLLVEVREEHLTEVRELLSGLDYAEITLASLGGPTISSENHIFVPATTG